jgi:hypothetical protein
MLLSYSRPFAEIRGFIWSKLDLSKFSTTEEIVLDKDLKSI